MGNWRYTTTHAPYTTAQNGIKGCSSPRWSDFSRYLNFFLLSFLVSSVIIFVVLTKKKSFWLVLLYILYLQIYFLYTLIIHILFFVFLLGEKKNVVLVLSQCTHIQTNLDTRWVLCPEQWRRLHSREIRFYFVFICLFVFFSGPSTLQGGILKYKGA